MTPNPIPAFSNTFWRALPALALAALLVCPSSSARAQQNAPSPPDEQGKTRLITVDDVVQMALTNNLDILITHYTPIQDQFALNGLFSAYDPAFSFNLSRTLNTQPGQFYLGFIFPPYTTIVNNYTPSLAGTLPSGLTYDLTAPLSQQTTPFSQYNATPNLTVSQPLLKNSWIDNTRYQIQLSRKLLRTDQLALRLQMENSVNAVKTAYYNLIAARQNVAVQRAAVALAQQLVDQNTEKVRLGALAPLDQRQAESQAASSQSDLLAAQLAQAVQENTLKSLLALHYDEWRDVTPVPAESLLAVPENPDLADCLRRAIESRPEMLQAKITIEKQHLAIKYTKNQLYPELDLKGSYGFNSVGALFGPTLDTIRQGTDPAYSYGLALTIPLQNTGARNAYKSAKATLEQTLLQLKKVETTIVVAVDNDVKTVRSDLLRVDATRKAREYAEDALRAGQVRLQAGSTTSFEVLQLQSSLTTARSAEIRALADYNIALEQLALDEGATLERSKLDIKMP
ncbi:MAG: TolC family protein [Verrucomicrobiota bacterium]|jgi:outer membrane protein TolC